MHKVYKADLHIHTCLSPCGDLTGENDEDAFGDQVIVDADDNVTGINPALLIGATGLSIEEIVGIIHRLGWLAIASHVDRELFSVTSQLGFIPENIGFDALELSPNYLFRRSGPGQEKMDFGYAGYPLVSFSDAHYPEDIGKSCTIFEMKDKAFEEIRKALCGIDERTVKI